MTNASTAKGREQSDAAALLGAAGAGDAARVESLLAAGADVNATSESGETALIRAASKGRLDVVRVLLAAGADANAEREDGFTALGVAVFVGHPEIVRALLAAGADPSAGRLGTAAEKWALFSGFTEIAEMLRDPARAPRAVRGEAGPGARVYFPDKGTFSPVVPLTNLDGPSPAAPPAGEGVVVTNQESEEPEAVTLVRPRKNDDNAALPPEPEPPSKPESPLRLEPPTPAPPVKPAARAQSPARSWPVMVIVLALSLAAGATTGALLLRSWRPAERLQTSPPPESPAPVVDAGAQQSQPPPADPTPEAPPPAAQLPEAGATTETETRAALNAAGDSTAGNTEEDKPAAPPAPRATDPENRRARAADTTARRDAPADARPTRPAPAAAENTAAAARRETPAPRRTRTAARPAPAVSRRDDKPPVFSPPPSKSKVIPWP